MSIRRGSVPAACAVLFETVVRSPGAATSAAVDGKRSEAALGSYKTFNPRRSREPLAPGNSRLIQPSPQRPA